MDYRIVRVVYVPDSVGNLLGEVRPLVEVYSVRDGTWRVIQNTVVPFVVSGKGVHVEGICYWAATEKPNNAEDFLILSFNFDSEVFMVLEFSHDVNHYPSSGLGASVQGSLGLLANWVDDSTELPLLEKSD